MSTYSLNHRLSRLPYILLSIILGVTLVLTTQVNASDTKMLPDNSKSIPLSDLGINSTDGLTSADQSHGLGLLSDSSTATASIISSNTISHTIYDFESYVAGQDLHGQDLWIDDKPCTMQVIDDGGNHIIRSGSCSNGQDIFREHSFSYTTNTTNAAYQFQARLLDVPSSNVWAAAGMITDLPSGNHYISFGLYTNTGQGRDNALVMRNSLTGDFIDGPSLTPGQWYDMRMDIDWSHFDGVGYGLATVYYRESGSSTWLSDANLTDIELSIADPSVFQRLYVRMDGIGSSRGEIDNIEIGQAVEEKPNYSTATFLMERHEDNTLTTLDPISSGWWFRNFAMHEMSGTHMLWLNSSDNTPGARQGIEELLTSEDGLIWENRTATNIVDNVLDYKHPTGIRDVSVDENGLFHGWHTQYYYWTDSMWTNGIRYVTSSDGLNWTVVNDPYLSSGVFPSFIENSDGTYESWITVNGDTPYTGPKHLRYRVTNAPNGNLGHWQTGGDMVTVDGNEVLRQTRVRKSSDGTYELFYRHTDENVIGRAVSTNGITFTSTVTNLIPYDEILPNFQALMDFNVHQVNGEDWFYMTYRTVDFSYHIVVIKPETAEAPEPAPLTVNPDSLTFTSTWGAESTTETLTISTTNGSTQTWSATTSESWIELDKEQGTTPDQIMVSVNSAGLDAGSHHGQIEIAPQDNLTDTLQVSVEINVLPPEEKPDYSTATVLMERDGDNTLTKLDPVSSGWRFRSFAINEISGTHTLWLNNSIDTSGQRQGIEERLTSSDGIIWENRANTNVTDYTPDYKYPVGIRDVVVDENGLYHGWHTQYYFSTSGMWTPGIRYMTSPDGLNWTVINNPLLSSGLFHTFIPNVNGTYESWIRVTGDTRYSGPRHLRYRVSNAPNGPLGHWQTGGEVVTVDGEEVIHQSMVHKDTNGTYKLFYRLTDTNDIGLATSTDGIEFTSVYTDLVLLDNILTDFHVMYDFVVHEVDGEYWFYVTYLTTDLSSHIVAIKPEAADPPVELTVNPGALTFTTTWGAETTTETLTIGTSNGFTQTWTATASESWIELDQDQGTAPELVSVNINTLGLNVGSYQGHIEIASQDNPTDTILVSVEANVLPLAGQSNSVTAAFLMERHEDHTLSVITPVAENWWLRNFATHEMSGTHMLWLNSSDNTPGARQGVEELLTSEDGLIWENRTATNIVDNVLDYKHPTGIRDVVVDENGIFHGWHTQYYYWTGSMWTNGIRYVTSPDGLNWTVVNDPYLSSGVFPSFIENSDGTYESWITVNGDTPYTGPKHLRYRVTNAPNGNLGHWQTGGDMVTVDGNEVIRQTRVRKSSDGTYELFYRHTDQNILGLATSTDGITFTSVTTDLVPYADILPNFLHLMDFDVHQVNGEDWFYMTYRTVDYEYYIVVLQVEATEEPEPATLIVDPASLVFSTTWGTPLPTETISITVSDQSTQTWTATVSNDWITLSSENGVAPDQVSVGINTAALEVGSYFGHIEIAPQENPTDTIQIPVEVHVQPDYSLELIAEAGYGGINLNWTLHSDINVTKYRILRRQGISGTFQQFSLLYKTQLQDSNTLVQGQEYCYFVEALDDDKNVIAQSNIDCAVMGETTLWIPEVSAPAGGHVFVPINIANGHGLEIASSDIWIEYDSSVISPTDITATPLTQGYTWSYSVEDVVGEPNKKRIRIGAFSSNPPKLYGAGSLFWVKFSVAGETGDESEIDLTEFVEAVGGSSIYTPDDTTKSIPLNLEDGRVTITDGYHLGDLNGNGVIEAVDAYLALQISLDKITPTADQIYAGDINGNQKIDIGDATMIFYHAVHGEWPTDAASRSTLAAQDTIELALSTVEGNAGNRVQIDLTAENITDMSSGQFKILYDPSIISQIISVSVGEAAADFTLDYNSEDQGVLQIGLLNNSSIDTNGRLFTIEVELANDLEDGTSTPMILAETSLSDVLGRDFETSAIQATISQESGEISITTTSYIYLPLIISPTE